MNGRCEFCFVAPIRKKVRKIDEMKFAVLNSLHFHVLPVKVFFLGETTEISHLRLVRSRCRSYGKFRRNYCSHDTKCLVPPAA